MRYHEIASGFRLPVSCEEQEVLDQAVSGVSATKLDDRSREVARTMVNRGLLNRSRGTDGDIVYRISSTNDIWRDA